MNTASTPMQGNDATSKRILVALATYRRPAELTRLLDKLMLLKGSFQVLVVDNDGTAAEGAALAKAYAATSRLPVEAIVEARQGLCHVRNTLFSYALAHYDVDCLALIDDDEWPDDAWLDELLRVQSETGADVVGGPVMSVFDVAPPDWLRSSFLFLPEQRPEGPTGKIWGINNVLITRRCLEQLDRPWFDPDFNTTGGEDVDFFTRLEKAGRRFAWAPRAIVYESVPASRARLSWIMRRGWRIGSTDMRIRLKGDRGVRAYGVSSVRAALALAIAAIALPARIVRPSKRADGYYALAKGFGRFYGIYGGKSNEYQ